VTSTGKRLSVESVADKGRRSGYSSLAIIGEKGTIGFQLARISALIIIIIIII